MDREKKKYRGLRLLVREMGGEREVKREGERERSREREVKREVKRERERRHCSMLAKALFPFPLTE
jgi:hypothetical protein